MTDDVFENGMTVRREVLGNKHVDKAELKKNEFTEEFQEFITRYAWGEVWTRPGLDRKTRSCVTLAMLIALNRQDELNQIYMEVVLPLLRYFQL